MAVGKKRVLFQTIKVIKMNCKLCKKELDAYFEGRLAEGTRVLVESHLKGCPACARSYRLIVLANKVMESEKVLEPNPFLATRVMVGIEQLKEKTARREQIPAFQKILKSMLISVSVGAAVFIGVIIGNIYKPEKPINEIPAELTYMNDAALESVNVFANR
jgi:predicted anti-sigma-YlaC factor YlaD